METLRDAAFHRVMAEQMKAKSKTREMFDKLTAIGLPISTDLQSRSFALDLAQLFSGLGDYYLSLEDGAPDELRTWVRELFDYGVYMTNLRFDAWDKARAEVPVNGPVQKVDPPAESRL